MKLVKMVVMVGTLLALSASHVLAGQFKITVTGVTYTNFLGSAIAAIKFSNKQIIGLVCPQAASTKGAQLLYDNSGETDGSGTNHIVIADSCGNTICQFAFVLAGSSQTLCTPETTGSLQEKACSIPVEFPALGGTGTAVVDFKQMVTTKGTNLVAKGTGVFVGPTGPGTLTISISGAFKPSSSCH